jgi:hypothetical protein
VINRAQFAAIGHTVPGETSGLQGIALTLEPGILTAPIGLVGTGGIGLFLFESIRSLNCGAVCVILTIALLMSLPVVVCE